YMAFDYDHTGGHFLGNNIVDVDKAFDRAGHIQEDVTYVGGGKFVTFEYTSFAAFQVGQGDFTAIYIHPFQARQGNLAEEVTYVLPKPTEENPQAEDWTLIEYDSSGGHFQVKNAVADRAWDPSGQHFAYDVVYGNGVSGAFEYTNTLVTDLT